MDTYNKMIAFGSIAVSYLLAQFTGLPVTLQILLSLMALDIIGGCAIALRDKTLSYKIAFSGVTRKGAALALILMAQLIEPMIALHVPLSSILAGYYIYVEALSILEHAADTGLPIPPYLRDALAKLNVEKTEPDPAPLDPGQLSHE